MGLSASPTAAAVASAGLTATATVAATAAAAGAAPLSRPLTLFREAVGSDVAKCRLHRIGLRFFCPAIRALT